MTRKPPPPTVKSFLLCRDIVQDRHSGEYILIGPFTGVQLPGFPATLRVSLYIHLTDRHGTYQFGLSLRDQGDNTIGQCTNPESFTHTDPLTPCQISWRDLGLQFPRPGRYHLVLQANGEDIATHSLDLVLQANG